MVSHRSWLVSYFFSFILNIFTIVPSKSLNFLTFSLLLIPVHCLFHMLNFFVIHLGNFYIFTFLYIMVMFFSTSKALRIFTTAVLTFFFLDSYAPVPFSPSFGSVSIDWVILIGLGLYLLLLGLPTNFLMEVRHCEFYIIVCWILWYIFK